MNIAKYGYRLPYGLIANVCEAAHFLLANYWEDRDRYYKTMDVGGFAGTAGSDTTGFSVRCMKDYADGEIEDPGGGIN